MKVLLVNWRVWALTVVYGEACFTLGWWMAR